MVALSGCIIFNEAVDAAAGSLHCAFLEERSNRARADENLEHPKRSAAMKCGVADGVGGLRRRVGLKQRPVDQSRSAPCG